MLDDLRNSSSFIDEDEPDEEEAGQRRSRRNREEKFLGMNAQQRFIISVMLFLMVCILGAFALVISGSVAIF